MGSSADLVFWDEYDARVAELYRARVPADGLPESAIIDAETRIGLSLPGRLREYYSRYGASELPLAPWQPCNLELMEILTDGVLLIGADELLYDLPFAGVLPDDFGKDDPPVGVLLTSPDDSTWMDALHEWSLGFSSLSGWLLTMLYWQASLNLPFTGSAPIDETELPEIVRHWDPPERFGRLGHELLVFRKPGRLLCVEGRAPDLILRAGARTKADFDSIVSGLTVDWDGGSARVS